MSKDILMHWLIDVQSKYSFYVNQNESFREKKRSKEKIFTFEKLNYSFSCENNLVKFLNLNTVEGNTTNRIQSHRLTKD